MPRRLNGWQQRDMTMRAGQKWPAVEPTHFDALVSRKGLTEEQAVFDPEIRSWIHRWYARRFVPEDVLISLGLKLTERELGFTDFNQPYRLNKSKSRTNTGVTQRDSP